MARIKMREQDWLATKSLHDVFSKRSLREKDARLLRLFAVACTRAAMKLVPSSPQLESVADAAESFADGSLTQDMLTKTRRVLKTAEKELGPVTDENSRVNVGPREEATFEILRALDRATGSKVTYCASAEFAQLAFAAFARPAYQKGSERAELQQVVLAREIFGNPFRPVAFDPTWRTADTLGIAARMYESRDFAAMPILADALEEAGCTNADVLLHCREPGVHVRGCWVVDLVLGKG